MAEGEPSAALELPCRCGVPGALQDAEARQQVRGLSLVQAEGTLEKLRNWVGHHFPSAETLSTEAAKGCLRWNAGTCRLYALDVLPTLVVVVGVGAGEERESREPCDSFSFY